MNQRAYNFKTFVFLYVIAILSTPQSAWAAPTVDQMFANFSGSAIQLFKFVFIAAMFIGLLLAGKGFFSLKEYADGLNGGRASLKKPLVTMLVGILLFSIGNSMNMATLTLTLGNFSGTNVMSEGILSGGAASLPGAAAAIKGILLFVKLIGLIAAVRGFLMIYRIGEGQGGNHNIGTALTHIFGGAAAVNIEATYNMLKNTVGF